MQKKGRQKYLRGHRLETLTISVEKKERNNQFKNAYQINESLQMTANQAKLVRA